MQIPFVGGAYKGRSTNISAQVCQNLFPVISQEGGKVAALMNTPGLSFWVALGDGLEVRGAEVMGSYLYVVAGNAVYRVDSSGVKTTMTGALLTSTGPVWVKNNGTQVMIVDGTYGYILAGTTVTQITDADFPIPSSLAYQDGYFIVTEKNSKRFYISASYDGTSWDALDYASKEGDPDNLQAVVSSHRELWLLGKTSYEVWYNSGDANFPFDRVGGATNRIGCAAPASAAEQQGTVTWLDNFRCVRVSAGYETQKISTEMIEYQFSQYETVSDATGFIYTQEGHTFYVLTFPTQGKSWVYDYTTQLWHTRARGVLDLRHRANCYAFFEGMGIVGDYQNGNLYKYDLAKYSDNGEPLRRIRAAASVGGDRNLTFHSSLEIEFEAGVGLVVDDAGIGSGTSPQAILQWSDDGGHTWSNEHWAAIGAVGRYKTRAIWRKLGRSRDRVYKVTIADPVKVVMIGAYLEAQAGTS